MGQKFNVYLNTLRQKGNLSYEYNPLYNYQTDVDLYIIDNKYIVPEEQAVNIKNGELLTEKIVKKDNEYINVWVDKRGNWVSSEDVKTKDDGNLWAKAGSLIDLDTEQLNFDLEHPVNIEVQPSYDGSVNLILNDNKNIPRLINSRFSVREKNTYEIVDRIGENDTNIYNSKTFNKDTSLYFQYEYNPTISYLGFVKGNFYVGQYCFYFTYCDADNNESDFIAETGLIPVFIGNDANPQSMDGGIKNQNSNKGVQLKLSNIDKSYNYLKIYYVRYFADYNQNRVYECKKINRRYSINSSTLYIQITGFEETEDLDPNILNISRFNPKSILAQAQCKNMLFFGNIVKNTDNYKELSDLALRIVPQLEADKNLGSLNSDYTSSSGNYAYYDSLNIYNKTGYFNQEYYRFGVVFIYQNGTLSNVYNTLGGVLDKNKQLNLKGNLYSKPNDYLLKRNYVKVNDDGWVMQDDNYTLSGNYINSKGVCRFNYDNDNGYDDKTVFYVKFKVPEEVSKALKQDLGIRGLFFVRQKCIPNIIAQCLLLNVDETLEAPVLETGTDSNKEFYTECFVNSDRVLNQDYDSRLYKYKNDNFTNAYAGICPDFLLNQPYYNQIFNGGKFRLQKVHRKLLKRTGRFFIENSTDKYKEENSTNKVIINSVTEEVPTVAIENSIFRTEMGVAEESFRFKYAEFDKSTYNIGDDTSEINEASNIVRGKYSPYLAIYSNSGKLETGCLYNIYQDSNISETQEYLNRMNSSEPFYSISDRYNITIKDEEFSCYRGDCYINQFTYRLNRNFNDPTLPNNDVIIDENTWKDNYDINNPSGWDNISRSDLNAIQLGSWITFKLRSAMNYAIRSTDHSYVSEKALMGSPRSFYPRSYLLQRGENKIPESYLYNDAYRASLGFKCYFTLQDINYIKDSFSNRIQYSAIAIQDSFKNNYRESLSTYFRDYSQEYGSIQKLIGFEGYILVVFEHGIGIAVINERVLAGNTDGEPVFINTKNVLPEELTIISDTYGTQWGESVVKSEAGYVYGVDTIAKKIWRVKGQQIEILSDFKVNKFLVNNISLGERELYPIIGLKNVKTHYNNNKKDIMFTFYDDVYKDEEKVWNLCYNELLGQFITFYSWVPSYSENIDTQFFTFDRNTSKLLTLLSKCNYAIPENSGVLLDSPVCQDTDGIIKLPKLYYATLNKSQIINYTIVDDYGFTTNKYFTAEGSDNQNGQYLLYNAKTIDSSGKEVELEIDFKIESDHWGNNKLFRYDKKTQELTTTDSTKLYKRFQDQKVILLYITPFISNINSIIANTSAATQFRTEVVALTLSSIVNNPLLTDDDKNISGLTTDFYLHGQSGIFNVAENLYPTHWYGEYHPFEFEFVVNDKIAQQKIFSNLLLISNKAEPESFHFEIEGDNYEFSLDKRNMYFRQEATKNLYQNLGSDIIYNRYYTDVWAKNYTQEQYYRIGQKYPTLQEGLVQQKKSTIFPLYYEKIDTYNDIYYEYLQMKGQGYDFANLSGSEIFWDRNLNQFNIITHIKNKPIDLFGRIRGNSFYKEGVWNIQIPTINFMQCNEQPWPKASIYKDLAEGPLEEFPNKNIPPIVINSQYVPKDIDNTNITLDTVPNIYIGRMSTMDDSVDLRKYIKVNESSWTSRKEAKIRDKFVKVRIRYSGKNLAIIHSVLTLYNISYN